MSLAEGIVDILEEESQRHGFERVLQVRVAVGALGGVEPEALQFCFDAVCRGTLAEGATLNIERVPGQAWCLGCTQVVQLSERYDACPQCGGFELQLQAGDELRLLDLEVR
jgi:hydrogenase nickel incorporation protein HypA/HybF